MESKPLPSAIHKTFTTRKAVSFLICIVIATFLWLINALNRSYTRTIAIPLKFVNYPVGRQLVNKQPEFIMADIRTSGAKLLMLLMEKSLKEITIDVSQIPGMRTKTSRYAVSMVNVVGNLSKHLNTEVELIKFKPDSIYFVFGKTRTKKVFIKPLLQVDYDIPQGTWKQVQVNPSWVIVSGDSLSLNQLDTLYTQKTVLNSLNKHVEEKIRIDVPEELDGIISLSAKEVILSVNFDEYAEKEIQIPIKTQNIPPSTFVKTFPDKVTIRVKAPYKMFDSIQPQYFKAMVNIDEKKQGMNAKLPIVVSSQLLNVKITQISPQKVEFIIRKQ